MSTIRPQIRPRRNRRGPNSARDLARMAVIVVVILLAGETFTRAIAEELPPPDVFGVDGELIAKREAYQAQPGVPDVVFFGDSAMDAGVDPSGFAEASQSYDSAYNLSLLGARLAVQQAWAVQQIGGSPPQVVVHEVNPVLLMDYGDDVSTLLTLDMVGQDRVRLAQESPTATINRWVGDQSYLYRYRKILQNPDQVWESTKAKVTGEPIAYDSLTETLRIRGTDGFWDQALSPSGQYMGYAGWQVDEKVPQGALQVFSGAGRVPGRMIALLDAYAALGIDPVIVIPPAPLEVFEASGIDVDRWLAAAQVVRELAEDAGLEVLDYTRAYPTDHFADPQHLNGKGSKAFTEDLAADLDALCAQGRVACG